MDAKKEYDAKVKAERTERAADRLNKPYRIWLYAPIYSIMYAVVSFILPVTVGMDIDSAGIVASLTNPVLLAMAVFMIGAGVIYDKNSSRLYQAVCAPVESIDIAYLKELNDVRKRTAHIVIAVNIIAYIFASKQFLTGSRTYEITYMTCLMSGCIVWKTSKDGDMVLEKLEADIMTE